MTRERALELAGVTVKVHDLDRNIVGAVRRSIADAILVAVAEEREECAKIADETISFGRLCRLPKMAHYISRDIRARGAEKVE